MATRVNYSGLVIAGIGFFLTRFTVALAIYEEPVSFYVGGVIPLVLGLGLAAFGVALVVADVDASLVRTTALWCVVGAGTMLVLVILTLVATNPGELLDLETVRSQTYLSNFLIGGSVGGTLTGLYAAHNQRQRVELRHQANRLEVLNRLLRHEILNAVTVIKGYASRETVRDPETWNVIEDRSDAIERTIDEVRVLARSARPSEQSRKTFDVGERITASLELIRGEHPHAVISVESPPDTVMVTATDHLDRVFTHLLEYAVAHSTADEPVVSVSLADSSNDVRVSIRYEGAPLSEDQRALLERGEIDRYDNPRMGFSLNVVRLLVENYHGSIETHSGPGGETFTVVLPRAVSASPDFQPASLGLTGVLPAVPQLAISLAAALVAGVAYGIASETLGGSIAGIGVFYGTVSPVVGWITHEFHSIVFGFIFLGLISQTPEGYRNRLSSYVAIGVVWAVFLWVVAAGIIAPIWLRLLGIPAPLPNFSPVLLVSHLVWGISLALLTTWGQQYLMPWLHQVTDRVQDGFNGERTTGSVSTK